MRNFILGFFLCLIIFLVYKQCTSIAHSSEINGSKLIQEQIKNVSKLVVTEGHFAEVFNYENSKAIFGDYLTADKKAIIIVNAQVTLSYDLSQLDYRLDEDSKTIEILKIPNQEISIAPDLEYYDIKSDFFNPFEAEDYNTIKESVLSTLTQKIEDSSLESNAENRLISELSDFFILTKSLGWTLSYKSQPVTNKDAFKELLLK